ncbi:DUF4192 family protein [Microbacterium sp. bgisy203]|uniref:DUF4192 family protein n=1 Tax=Microbacterium sp. bgisy203 TaxID=3413799 RepID=UPI003D762789
MSVTVKAADAAQFLSLVPRLLGFTPTQSVVLVPMARGRSLGAMRVDLPPESAPGQSPDDVDDGTPAEIVDTVASSAIGMICRIDDADAVLVVVYTDAPFAGGPDRAIAGAHVVGALMRQADACGLRVVDALTVAGDGWGSHLEHTVPAGGHPLDLLRVRGTAATALADAGLDGSPPGDQVSGAALPRVPKAARKAVAEALRSLAASLEVICGIPSTSRTAPRIDPAALEAACALDDLPSTFEEALGWNVPAAPMRAAMLAWCLARPSLRDIALVQWATDIEGGDIAMEAQRLWEDGAEYPADLASVMWGEGPRPDALRLEAALDLAREVAALAPRTHKPGPLAVCAWLSWALGRSTHADRYATMALSFDDEHGLAEIVRSFVHAGHLPDWAFRLR